MSHDTPRTEFSGKTWIFVAQVVVFGSLGGFSLIMGPLFLTGVIKPANGRPGNDAGIALTIMSIPLLLVFALAVFNLVARRRPILRLCREGLEVNIIGASSLDGIPLIPGLVRVAWLVISMQGFKQQIMWVPWHYLGHVVVSGPPMARRLTIDASIPLRHAAPEVIQSAMASQITFHEVAFDASLDQIAASIIAYSQNSASRARLPSLSG